MTDKSTKTRLDELAVQAIALAQEPGSSTEATVRQFLHVRELFEHAHDLGARANAAPDLPAPDDDERRLLLAKPIDQMDLTVRAVNSVIACGIETVGDLVARTAEDLFHAPHLGRKSLEDIVNMLADHGLKLADDVRVLNGAEAPEIVSAGIERDVAGLDEVAARYLVDRPLRPAAEIQRALDEFVGTLTFRYALTHRRARLTAQRYVRKRFGLA
ncbi:DNA-directed RNA polymerase subunit alpha C-terminal domain-containing protein [Caballeronia jiangsuensis]|uniref:DNA-directed RNA polymerase subunit alpha C-terminal domain-containing protein n=1 Tax=Caballeronia jiangsuensis TaxID=1458357 RepID=A0ABW9CZT6_9BURK